MNLRSSVLVIVGWGSSRISMRCKRKQIGYFSLTKTLLNQIFLVLFTGPGPSPMVTVSPKLFFRVRIGDAIRDTNYT